MATRWQRAALRAGLCLLLGLAGVGCDRHRPIPDLDWHPVDALNQSLPPAIRVYATRDSELPLRAWHVRVDLHDSRITPRVVQAEGEDGLETPAQLAARLGARVVVNGGYFRTQGNGVRHVGLLATEGELREPAIDSILHGERRYYTARAALGLRDRGGVDVAWVSSRKGQLFEHREPLANANGQPIEGIDFDRLGSWAVRDAVAAGPALVVDGRVRVTADEEVFYGTAVPEAHPRTAAGYTREGELILLVVDGRQPASGGLDLEGLAHVLRDLGCVEALNLDGGGSSALVVDGVLVNRPEGGERQREVLSAVAVFSEERR